MHRIGSAMLAGLLLATGVAALTHTTVSSQQTRQMRLAAGLVRMQPVQAFQTRQPEPAAAVQPERTRHAVDAEVERAIAAWPEESRKAARATTEKYGPPSSINSTRLEWIKNGPWKRTVVHAEPLDHNFPMEHKDVLENVINYRVPMDQFDELARFDGSIIAFRTGGEMSARCDDEAANFLALNLAHEVVTGKRSVEEARQLYGQHIQAHRKGRPSEYTQGLMFQTEESTGDPDRPVIIGLMAIGGEDEEQERREDEPAQDPPPPRKPNTPEPRTPGPPR